MSIQITIHIDPVIVGDKKLDKLTDNILGTLNELDKKITIHDFRVLHGKTKKIVVFDAVLPFECKYDYEYLENILKKKYKNYYFNIEIDRPYC